MAKKKTEENAMTTTDQAAGELVTFKDGESWGAGKKVEAREILISKILMIQPNNGMCNREDIEVRAGDFVDSLTEEVIGSREKTPINFIVLDSFKTRQTFEQEEGSTQAKYVKSEPWIPEYEDRDKYPWEGRQHGKVTVTWKEVRHYYVLLEDDIKKGRLPKVISFKGTSMKAAGTLASFLSELDALGAPSAARFFSLTCSLQSKNNNDYWVMNVRQGRFSTPEEVEKAFTWWKSLQAKIQASEVTVHETEETESEAVPSQKPREEPVSDEDIPF